MAEVMFCLDTSWVSSFFLHHTNVCILLGIKYEIYIHQIKVNNCTKTKKKQRMNYQQANLSFRSTVVLLLNEYLGSFNIALHAPTPCYIMGKDKLYGFSNGLEGQTTFCFGYQPRNSHS